MALPTIDTAFVEEFEAGVHLAYQRMGSHFRGTVRTVNGVKNKTTFQKMGKGTATQKARHGDIPAMNLAHTVVSVTLEDWYAGEWIDDLDVLRINHDEKMVAMQSGAAALGRKTDEQITTAMNTTTTTDDHGTTGFTETTSIDVMETLGTNDVPNDGQRYCAVGWPQWGQLLAIDSFANADYIGRDNLPFKNAGTAKEWLTMMWFPTSAVPAVDSDTRTCFAWHKSAVGHAIGADVQTNMAYHNDKDSWFVNNKMQMNAVLIDVNGCISMDVDDTPS